jgi:hypothetical protein
MARFNAIGCPSSKLNVLSTNIDAIFPRRRRPSLVFDRFCSEYSRFFYSVSLRIKSSFEQVIGYLPKTSPRSFSFFALLYGKDIEENACLQYLEGYVVRAFFSGLKYVL